MVRASGLLPFPRGAVGRAQSVWGCQPLGCVGPAWASAWTWPRDWKTGVVGNKAGALVGSGGGCRGGGQAGERGRGPVPDPGSHMRLPAARSGLLRLAEALAFRGDSEVVNSTVRAVVATLRSGEKCGVEPELVGKGNSGPGTVRTPSLAAEPRGPSPRCPRNGACGQERRSARRLLPWPKSPGLSVPESGGPGPARAHPRSWSDAEHALFPPAVLRGLIEAGSPHLEELLAALFATASPTWRPVAVLSSLLLQEKEPPAPGEPEADSCRLAGGAGGAVACPRHPPPLPTSPHPRPRPAVSDPALHSLQPGDRAAGTLLRAPGRLAGAAGP